MIKFYLNILSLKKINQSNKCIIQWGWYFFEKNYSIWSDNSKIIKKISLVYLGTIEIKIKVLFLKTILLF